MLTRAVPPAVVPSTSELFDRILALEARMAALERASGPRDAADEQLPLAVYHAAEGSPFRLGAMIARSKLERYAALRAALMAADITSHKQLGKLLERLMKGGLVQNVRVTRVKVRGRLMWWCVSVSSE